MAPGSKSKAPAWKDTAKCCCLECSKDPRGFKTQSRQIIGRHTRRDKEHAALDALSNTKSVLAFSPVVTESLAAIADSGVSTPSLEQPGSPEDFNLDFVESDLQFYIGDAPDDDDFAASEHPTADSELQPASPHVIEFPTAHRETLAVQLAYLHATRPIASAERQLNGELKIIALCGALPTHPRPARTIVTAKRRLGLELDDYIEQRPICNLCYKFYSHNTIKNAASPNCTQPQCKGVLYREKRGFQDDNNPDADLDQQAIRRFLQRPDFIRSLRDTSGDSRCPPISSSTMMTDLHDWPHVVNGQGRVQDIKESPGLRRSLLDCDVGLSMTLNVDWFGITENRPHSAGGVYISFNNLHQSARFLQQNIHLATVIPGPKEPSLEQLNHPLEPLIADLKMIYAGVVMEYFNRDLPPKLPEVHGALEILANDIPGCRKTAGFAGHSHKIHPCNIYFELHNDFTQLRNANSSKMARSQAARTRILDAMGVRYSCLDELPGWTPVQRSVVDFMHNFYGQLLTTQWQGIEHSFHSDIIVAGYLLGAAGWRVFQDTINGIIWPSGIGRLPNNTTILWVCWRDKNDKIKTIPPPVPLNCKSRPTFCQNPREIYNLVLYLSVAERILASKAISMDELGIHMLINHHMSMHYQMIFKNFGPTYGWWLFAFEHCNGDQQKVNLNGHADEKQLFYDLATRLPENADDDEKELIRSAVVQKGADRGTLRMQISGFGADGSILTPRRIKKPCDLRKLAHPDIYSLLLQYAHTIWTRPPDYGSRIPCRLLYHFKLSLPGKSPVLCTIFKKFYGSATDLGVYTAYTNCFHEKEVISTAAVGFCCCHCPSYTTLWIVHSFDQVRASI
ncbi:uncharacterized protein EDB91DRAFT_1234802 [Suillus paluster]|uniref:uncharacterized protein n=1 Tax=Suillus paluster TaxID=48578 RepID=UPI001B8829B9|nr:uncharacterized protein EDB91DRAFT_1234802 [Suillus paluster]KAG1751405.1 hypothetical protein EDB91DRAFT_1234802 [Suillus paluster]